jgi:hypothetical protein
VYWLAHNQVLFSNPLEFYNGYWSAKAIYQRALDGGMARYPGDHDWAKAAQYVAAAREAVPGLAAGGAERGGRGGGGVEAGVGGAGGVLRRCRRST